MRLLAICFAGSGATIAVAHVLGADGKGNAVALLGYLLGHVAAMVIVATGAVRP